MLNKVMFIGNLGKDPETRLLNDNKSVAKFSLATSEGYKDQNGSWQEKTQWHDVICWRKLAERAGETLHKGDTVYVQGKLTHRTWEDKDGNNRRTTEVVADYFRIIRKGGTQRRETVTETESGPSDLPF